MVNMLERPPVRAVSETKSAGRRTTARLTLPTLLTLTAIVTIVPFAAMVMVAFAPPSGRTFPDALNPANFTLDNFSRVLSSSDIPRWTVNSLLYSLVYFLYDSGFKYFDFGYASAIGLVLFLIVLIVSLVQRRLVGRDD